MDSPKVAILVDTATGWGRRIVRGVLDHCIRHGTWDLWIEPRGRDENYALTEFGLDGVIARVVSDEMALELRRRKIPTVNVSGILIKGSPFPRVTTDLDAAAKLAEAHFRDRGLSNFAYVGPLHLPHVRKQESAFKRVLAASGTRCHLHEEEADHPPRSSDDRLIAWLKDLPKPIGIYTWGSATGRRIIRACRQADITVPHDVAVLGGDFDDLLCDSCHPALSGIVTPATQIGCQSAAILRTLMEGGQPPRDPVFLPPRRIEERLSTDILAINDPQIRQALIYLRAHACEDITVEDILKSVPMARRSLERRFLQLLGRTPAQEMTRLRIDRARALLTGTNLSLDEIAEACGYASYNYLGTIFKKNTGLSPAKYRNQARGQ